MCEAVRRAALVTGGGKGIGRPVCLALATSYDGVPCIESEAQSFNRLVEVDEQDNTHTLLDSIARHLDQGRHLVELDSLPSSQQNGHLAGSLGIQALGQIIQRCGIMVSESGGKLMAHLIVNSLDGLGVPGFDHGRFDGRCGEVSDVSNSHATPPCGEDLEVQISETCLVAGECHAESRLLDAVAHRPWPEVCELVQPQSKAQSSHFQRIARGRC